MHDDREKRNEYVEAERALEAFRDVEPVNGRDPAEITDEHAAALHRFRAAEKAHLDGAS